MSKFCYFYVGILLIQTSSVAVSEVATYGPYTKHFWSCAETGVINGLSDVAGGMSLPSGHNRTFEQGDAYTVRSLSWSAVSLSTPFYN